jgi:hypothetical protein
MFEDIFKAIFKNNFITIIWHFVASELHQVVKFTVTHNRGYGYVLNYFFIVCSKTTKLILLDSLLQEVVATLLHLVFQKPSTAKM